MDHFHLLLKLSDVLAVVPLASSHLVVSCIHVQAFELVQDTAELAVARMILGHLELLSLEPVPAEIAVDLELWTGVLEMLLDALKRLDRLGTTETLNFEYLAF